MTRADNPPPPATEVQQPSEVLDFEQTRAIKLVAGFREFKELKDITPGQQIKFDVVAEDNKTYRKQITVEKADRHGGIMIVDGKTENGNSIQIEFDIHDKDSARIHYAPKEKQEAKAGSPKSVENKNLVEPYDPDHDDFTEWIEKNNGAIFDRYAKMVLQIFEDLKKENKLSSDPDFFARLAPTPRTVNKPVSEAQLKDLSTKLLTPIATGGAGLESQIPGAEKSNTINIFLKSTGKSKGTEPIVRKLYVSPELTRIDEFISEFYKILDSNGTSIRASKIHTDDAKRNTKDEIVAQAHNTFVIYLADDKEIPKVLSAIREAQKNSGVPLAKYSDNETPKTPAVLDSQVIVGGQDMGMSFDNWSNALAYYARELYKKKGTATLEEIKQVMAAQLNSRTKRTPERYLSVSA